MFTICYLLKILHYFSKKKRKKIDEKIKILKHTQVVSFSLKKKALQLSKIKTRFEITAMNSMVSNSRLELQSEKSGQVTEKSQ